MGFLLVLYYIYTLSQIRYNFYNYFGLKMKRPTFFYEKKRPRLKSIANTNVDMVINPKISARKTNVKL
jgi:hypothetical protein